MAGSVAGAAAYQAAKRHGATEDEAAKIAGIAAGMSLALGGASQEEIGAKAAEIAKAQGGSPQAQASAAGGAVALAGTLGKISAGSTGGDASGRLHGIANAAFAAARQSGLPGPDAAKAAGIAAGMAMVDKGASPAGAAGVAALEALRLCPSQDGAAEAAGQICSVGLG